METGRLPAREAAKRELSKGAYHENDPNLLQRALDHVWDWFGDILSAAAGASPGGPAGLVVLLLIVIALAAALWWRLGVPQRGARPADSLFEDGPRSTADHRTAAEAHAVAGRWNQAVQERMRAIVRSLEERTLLDPRPDRTAARRTATAAGPSRNSSRITAYPSASSPRFRTPPPQPEPTPRSSSPLPTC
ncbi:hypothetical protein [Streptomyces sp. A1277]|uniref:hypothetical protein n=1 Tax=Streptomyces sp. A1277 TaxID=2563103 RepID=UPI001F0E4EF3|nr:hypothetical protein [Streptomyces sp. A1277]